MKVALQVPNINYEVTEDGALIGLQAAARALHRLEVYPVGSYMDGHKITADEYEEAMEQAYFMYADCKLVLKWDHGYTEQQVNALVMAVQS